MQNLRVSRNLSKTYANQPTSPAPVFFQTNLNAPYHTAVSFNLKSTIKPTFLAFTSTAHLSTEIMMAAQYQPSGEPPDINTNTLALHANLEDDSNDSDFM